MSAKILDGKVLARRISDDLARDVAQLKKETGRVPHLVNVLIGKDDGACAYANSQKKTAERIGIKYDLDEMPEDISQEKLLSHICSLNENDDVNGILLHKPFPPGIDYRILSGQVAIEKDVEGINVANIGKMIVGETNIIPCTPAAVMAHIQSTGIDLRGQEAVVVGHSEIVGKPLSLLLLEQYATVTVAHVATSERGLLAAHVQRADILVVAVGRPSLIPGEWIKPGAIVVDVGINKVDDKIVGDIDFEGAREKAAFITPVPGGVGPVTVVMLMKNGMEAFKKQMVDKS